MALLHRLIAYVARRVASDPRVQQKAGELMETELKPRARVFGRQAKAKFEVVKEEVKDIAREADPRENPRAFVLKVKERIKELKDLG